MLKALASGTSGLNAQQIKVDVLANNLANVNTTGFKKSRADFSELVNQEVERNGIPVSRDSQDATLGSGVHVAEVVRNFKPGSVVETGRPLDLAVLGEGFFKVILPGGEERYTRDGNFSLDQEGNFVTSSGATLEGVQLPPGSDKFTVSSDGVVKVESSDGGDSTDAGQISLYTFTNMNGLQAEGENLFSYNNTAGEAISGNAGSEGFGSVKQGALETANVDLVEEMASLIEAQRAYGFNARTVRTADDMWGLANNLRK